MSETNQRKKYCRRSATIFVAALSLVAVVSLALQPGESQAAVMSSGSYRMVADVVSGGGGDSASGSYVLRQTVGQPSAIGPSESVSYLNYAGFWYSAIFAELKKPAMLGPILLLLLGDDPSQ